MKRRTPEYSLQLAVASYLNFVLPDNCWWTFIPGGTVGGGATAARRGAQIKRMGYAKGSPDIIIIKKECVLFLELKSPTGHLSPAQIATHEKLHRAAARVEVCRSIDDVKTELILHGIIRSHARAA